MSRGHFLKLRREYFLKSVLRLVALVPLGIMLAAPTFAQTPRPAVVSSRGYLNGDTADGTHDSGL